MTKIQQPTLSGIEQAVAQAGSQSALAALLSSRFPHKRHITQQAISQWVNQGHVPLDRAKEVSSVSGVPMVALVSPEVRDLVQECVTTQ